MSTSVVLTWIAFIALLLTCITIITFFIYFMALPTIRVNKYKKTKEKEEKIMAYKIDKLTAQQLIESNKKFLGEKAYNEILNNPMDYSYTWLNKLEAIANGPDEPNQH